MTERVLVGVVVLVGLAGCDPAPEGGCAPCDGRDCAPTLEIGLGTDGFAPLAEGGDFPLVHGPQGGYHLDIGLRATHIDASTLLVGRLEGAVDGETLASGHPWLDFRCVDGAFESWGTRLVYDAVPAELDGRTTALAAEVTDASGAVVSTAKDVRIVDAP